MGPPTRASRTRQVQILLIAGVAILVGVVAAVVVALVVARGGDGAGRVPPPEHPSVTTAAGTTYTLHGVTTSDTAEEIEQEVLSDWPDIQIYEPTGTYVAVQLDVTGAAAPDTTGTTFVLVDGDGTRQSSGITIETFGDSDEPTVHTELYDVPTDALGGSRLEITESGTTYTLDLGM